MLDSLSSLCQAINMPQEVTTLVLSTASQLDFPSLQPTMNLLFSEATWKEGLAALKTQLQYDPQGIKMLTCMLFCVLRTQQEYACKGIPQEIFLATMDCFPRFVREHKVSFGTYGFDRDFWTVRQLSCVLFRVGLLEYELAENTVSLHIPSGAKLEPRAIDASLQEGRAFLAKFFPAWADKPMRCHSWLLSPTLKELLPPRSNIRRFQDRFSVTPTGEPNSDFLMWVFKNDTIPYPQLPENTSLQRKLKTYLCAGGEFADARGILV